MAQVAVSDVMSLIAAETSQIYDRECWGLHARASAKFRAIADILTPASVLKKTE